MELPVASTQSLNTSDSIRSRTMELPMASTQSINTNDSIRSRRSDWSDGMTSTSSSDSWDMKGAMLSELDFSDKLCPSRTVTASTMTTLPNCTMTSLPNYMSEDSTMDPKFLGRNEPIEEDVETPSTVADSRRGSRTWISEDGEETDKFDELPTINRVGKRKRSLRHVTHDILPILARRPSGADINVLAIPAFVALLSFGRGLRSSASDDAMCKHKVHVMQIDQFWSHSWQDSAWKKISTLLLFYNGWPSAVAGLMGAFAAGCCLGGFTTSPEANGILAMVVAFASFFCVLCSWQHKANVFLDKACIEQNDKILKESGILSLSFILRRSREMLILWDENYTKRLWCVFELAARLKQAQDDGKDAREISILISGRGGLAVAAFVLHGVVTAILSWFDLLGGAGMPMWRRFAENAVVLVVLAPLLLESVWKVHLLREQVQNFSAAQAGCFCCSNGHKDPKTNETMGCDRELINSAIATWFGSVDKFDTHVKTHFMQEYGDIKHYLPCHYAVLMTMPTLWISFGEGTWLFLRGYAGQGLWCLVSGAINLVLFGPGIYNLLCVSFGYVLQRMGSEPSSQLLRPKAE